MHAQENTQTLTIVKIDTVPEYDPYVNLSGHSSYTEFWLDPRDRTCGVTQEYRTNSMPMDEWHKLVLTWRVFGHPHPDTMRQWITESMHDLMRLCDGFEDVWDGHNVVGRYTEEAQKVIAEIEQKLGDDMILPNYYEFWEVGAWLEQSMHEITAQTTDEELANLAGAWEPTDDIILDGDILKYITGHRDNLVADEEE